MTLTPRHTATATLSGLHSGTLTLTPRHTATANLTGLRSGELMLGAMDAAIAVKLAPFFRGPPGAPSADDGNAAVVGTDGGIYVNPYPPLSSAQW